MYTHQRLSRKPSSSTATSTEGRLFKSRPFQDETLTPAPKDEENSESPINSSPPVSHHFSQVSVGSSNPAPIQPKLTVGAPGDQYEQEADSVAQQVMSMEPPVQHFPLQREMSADEPEDELQTKPLAATITPVIQRDMAGEEQEEEVQAKPLFNFPVQREMMAGEEQEEEVQAKPLFNFPVQREMMAGEEQEEEVQAKPLFNFPVQREMAGEEQEEETLQTKSSTDSQDGLTANTDLETQLNNSRGNGSPLPDQVRSFMEPRFGVDFSQVKVHTDSSAVQMNKGLGAQAFTHGSNIYFGAGKSPTDLELTAHELTHVVQQTGGEKIQNRLEPETHSAPNIAASTPQIQMRQPSHGNEHVGGDPHQITFLADERGNIAGPGDAGFTHRMLAQAGNATEDLIAQGLYADARLTNVVPSLDYLDKQIVARGKTKARYEGKVRGDDAIFAPWGIALEMYQGAVDWCQDHINTMTAHKQQQTEKADQYNAWVPRANGFFTSLTRLEAMQNMLGVTDPKAMASALTSGLQDAKDVAARATDAYVGGNLTGKLQIPPSDETVTALGNETTLAAQKMNTKYLGFQRNVLALERAKVNAEGEQDRKRLGEIEEVKQFVRNVGKTIDVTAAVVTGSPAVITNVTGALRHGEARINAARNRSQIMEGQRPTHNPTYLAVNDEGQMVVRNVQTGMDRPAEGGEATASPAGPSLQMPSDVSGLLGQITDFAYASEVREINSRLEQIKARCSAIDKVREALEVRQAAQDYQDALNEFALKCNQLQQRVAERRTAYWQLGVDLDNFARKDPASRESGQAPGQKEEKFATIMTTVGQIREVLSVGNGAKQGIFTPEEVRSWAQGMNRERGAYPPRTDIPVFEMGNEEWSRISQIYSQVKTFGENVDVLNGMFGQVESEAKALLRQIQVGGGSGAH